MKFCFLAVLIALFSGGVWMEWSKAPAFVFAPETPTLAAVNDSQAAPIVIELFTSEGCSSCPPADALLAQIAQAASQQNAEIIPLSEHVDYWNYIGWADPFSSAQFSERQRLYAQAFGASGQRDDVYTPQMVVDGRYGFVGSNATKAQEAIKQAFTAAKATVQLARLPNAANQSALTIPLRINVAELPKQNLQDRAEILLAITEDDLSSNVVRGENRGRRLPHTAVTRELRVLGEYAPSAKSFETTANVKLNETWKRNALRIVVFVQAQKQRHILGAASLRLNEN
jgi:hypothetical protein